MNHDDYRRESRRAWGAAARGWKAHPEIVREAYMPVSLAMVEALGPQPGHRILELAAGTGEVGFLAAELIQPGGELITSDFAPEMLTAAQERAQELGLRGVRFKQIDAESIDLGAASLDGVLCRWGYFLMADPEAALRETRRVLKPGGILVLAAWSAAEENPWASVYRRVLHDLGLAQPPEPGAPDQFAWADPALIEEQLAQVGFVDDIRVEAVDWRIRYPSFEAWWATTLEMSQRTRSVVERIDGDTRERIRAAVREAAQPYAREDGALAIPARSWVASAAA